MADDSWSVAVDLVARFLKRPARMSHLLDRVPPHWDAGKRRACQSLLFGTVRHISLLERALDAFLRKRPKPGLWASLLVASRELMENPERGAKVVHHAVSKIGERFSAAEKGLANAVLRKVALRLPELLSFEAKTPEDLAWRYSHPEWLVRRWLSQWGWTDTVAFLEWNQAEASLFARWQRDPVALADLKPLEDGSDFFTVAPGRWECIAPLVEAGRLYVQNPAAAIAPRVLAEAAPQGRLLDLCAAPGGKALLLERLAGPEVEEIVSVDLAGPRFERMLGNLRRYEAKRARALAMDLFELDVAKQGAFEGVLLDAPCSNTGVLQHKVDARWRQSPESITAIVELQSRMLVAASSMVKAGGVLVYSTCSVDTEENAEVVARFLESENGAGFALERSELSLPWKDARDGAGVFLLRKARS